MLQTGQVLFRRLSVDFALVLPFKDSSEAAEPRCATPIAIKLPDTPRRSEAPPRWIAPSGQVSDSNAKPLGREEFLEDLTADAIDVSATAPVSGIRSLTPLFGCTRLRVRSLRA
jgi:hypothetical protein